MLSFLFYYLLKNPKAYQAAQEEVDRVVGKSAITVDHMAKLPYLTACLRETLRLQPTAPGFGVSPKAGGGPVIIKSGDKAYSIPEGNIAVLSLPQIHRDPLVYGDDAEEFRVSTIGEWPRRQLLTFTSQKGCRKRTSRNYPRTPGSPLVSLSS
jgi:cytochrome P450/NADPH-cytochrome P450 reductase